MEQLREPDNSNPFTEPPERDEPGYKIPIIFLAIQIGIGIILFSQVDRGQHLALLGFMMGMLIFVGAQVGGLGITAFALWAAGKNPQAKSFLLAAVASLVAGCGFCFVGGAMMS